MRRVAPQPGEAPGRRLLLVNPNADPAVDELVRAAARRVLGPGDCARVIHPEGAPCAIESAADRAIAEPLALALLAAEPGYDAYVLACFDDIALAPARRLGLGPVVGAVEASLALARTLSDRILVLTTVAAAVPGIEALVGRYGGGAGCAVEAARIGVAEAARRGPETAARLRDALEGALGRSGAGVVILGSAGLGGWAEQAAAFAGVPVIDPIEAAVRLGLAAAATRAPAPAG
ncbi:MAG: Asp/Glu racemase [Rhodovulum sulfidophilum]|uniref:Asp/Glu racemase n=1 Tax=Rhodovulum sulfidophilum TaxID=35806 RepID=A0A2W5N765_RHOSU|nr:MAG: Asp/Glu racemase [Rhodovulum sulfidophilum]